MFACATLAEGEVETESVEVHWTPPESNGGVPITSYELSQDGGIVWSDVGEGQACLPR